MVKTLKRKFVISSMIAITTLIVLLLGAVNIGNIIIKKRNVERTLSVITNNAGSPPPMRNDESDAPLPPPTGFSREKNDYDTFMSSNFFFVKYDSEGNVVLIDTSRTSSVTEDKAKEYAESVLNTGNDDGKIDDYRYKIVVSDLGDKTVIFLDTSGDIGDYLRVLALSAFVGFLCEVLMLLLVIALSNRAIKPIAENMAKQKEFVTNAGHELKTPLAIISANAEAMEMINGENKWTKNIVTQVERLSKMTENLLFLSKMEEYADTSERVEISLGSEAKKAALSYEEAFELKNINYSMDNLIESPRLIAKPDEIRKLINILLDNMLKYTKEGGNAAIEVFTLNGKLVLMTRNTVENAEKIDVKALFDRFYREDKARTQGEEKSGFGIGLAVAKEIVERHKGKIYAKCKDGEIGFIVEFKNM